MAVPQGASLAGLFFAQMEAMNSLEQFIKTHLHDSEAEVMNILQDRNAPVSDLAVHACDIPNSGQVISWINHHSKLFHWKRKPTNL